MPGNNNNNNYYYYYKFIILLSGSLRDSLYVILGSKSNFTIRYYPMEYVCRPLERLEKS